MNWALRQNPGPMPKFVLVVLADAANDQGICWPRVSVIAGIVGVSTRTVQRALQLLARHGLITVEQRFRSDGSHSSNLYRLLLDRGVSASPPPDRGGATPGHPCQGPPDAAVIPGTTIGTEKEPPQPLAPETGLGNCGGGDHSELHYPKDLLPAERTQAGSMIAGLDAAPAQQVLDEWAGILAAGDIRASSLGCLRTLIKRAQAAPSRRSVPCVSPRHARHDSEWRRHKRTPSGPNCPRSPKTIRLCAACWRSHDVYPGNSRRHHETTSIYRYRRLPDTC